MLQQFRASARPSKNNQNGLPELPPGTSWPTQDGLNRRQERPKSRQDRPKSRPGALSKINQNLSFAQELPGGLQEAILPPRGSILEPPGGDFRGLGRFICSLPGSSFDCFSAFPEHGPRSQNSSIMPKPETRPQAIQTTACNETPCFKQVVGGVAYVSKRAQ